MRQCLTIGGALLGAALLCRLHERAVRDERFWLGWEPWALVALLIVIAKRLTA